VRSVREKEREEEVRGGGCGSGKSERKGGDGLWKGEEEGGEGVAG